MTLALVLAEAAAQAAPVKGVAAVANNFQVALMAFKAGGWIVALIGAAAMVGRLLVDEADDASWQRSLRHVLAAAIFAVIAYFVMFQWELSSLNKAIVQGLCGAVAPELVDWLSTTIRKKLGFKDKQKDPAWKSLFKRKKKPKRRRRAEGRPGQGRTQEGREEARRQADAGQEGSRQEAARQEASGEATQGQEAGRRPSHPQPLNKKRHVRPA